MYITLSRIFQFLAPLYISKRIAGHKEDPIRYREKLGDIKIKRPNSRMVWFHAASVGESSIAINLIRAIHAKHPELNFLLTTVTLSSCKLIEGASLCNTIHQYAPLDTPNITKKFIEHWSPDLAVFIESEIWPNLLINTEKFCNVILVNGRLSDKSFQRWKILRSTMSRLLQLYHVVQPGTKIDFEKFSFFYDKNMQFIGNLKNAAPAMEYKESLLNNLTSSIKDRKVFIAASTHRGEEDIVIQAHKELKRLYPDLLTIIAPRHIDRTDEISHLLDRNNISYSLYSRDRGLISDDTDIYIVDAIGELGAFFRVGKIAFIGGSLVKVGGHNILEPAKIGLIVLSGIHTFNFTEIVAQFIENNAILVVKDKDDIIKHVQDLFDDQNYMQIMQNRSLQVSNQQTTAMQTTVDYISSFIMTRTLIGEG